MWTTCRWHMSSGSEISPEISLSCHPHIVCTSSTRDFNPNKEAGRLYAELLSLADDIWHLHTICTSCRWHPHVIHMSSACHEDNILMSSTCHLHIQNLPELPNFMTWLVFICYIVSAESLILSLIFGWTLSVQDVLLISFSRKFCNLFLDQFGFEYCFWYMFCFWLDLPVLGQ